jgi:hypothetical protein
LGLNPLGQALCRHLYEQEHFETVLVFNSPSFSAWNRYPVQYKPPVVPVQGMINNDIMIVFGDVFVKEFEWVTDMLFYLRGNVPHRFMIAAMNHDGPTCGQVLSKKGERLLERMGISVGRSDFYDGLIGPLLSIGKAAGLDSIGIFLERVSGGTAILQIDDTVITQEDVISLRELLDAGIDL